MQHSSARLGHIPELQNSGLMQLQPASQNEVRTPKGISKLGAFPLKIKNHFVSEKKPKSSHDSVIERGFEHDNDVTTDEEFYQKIFNHNLYNPTSENLIDYFLEIRRMMDSVGDKDTGNVGAVVGMTVFGLFGFLGFSFTIVGGIAAGVLGGTLGRYAGKKLRRKIKNKGPITQEEIFITKIQCMVKVGKLQKEFLKHNLNKYRILIERIIEESSMGFNIQIFQDQKKIIKVITKLRDFMVSVLPQKAILLTYKLFKIHFKQNGLEDPDAAKEAASKLNKVLIPYIRLIEINDKASSKTIKKLSNLVTYQKIRKLLLKPEIIKLLERYPDPKEEPEYVAKFTELLRQHVNFDQQQLNLNAQELQNLEENNQTYVRSPEVSAIGNGPTDNILLESPKVQAKPRLTVNVSANDKSMESINSADLEEKNEQHNQLPYQYGTSKFKHPNTQTSESERANTGPNKTLTTTQPLVPKSPKTAFLESFKQENMAPQNPNENDESSEDSSVNKDHEESVEKLADDSALYHKDLSHVLTKNTTKAKSDKPIEESKEQKQYISLEKVLDKKSISQADTKNTKNSAGLKTPKFDQSPVKKQTVHLENVEVDFEPSRTIVKPELVKMNSFSNVTLHDEEAKKEKKEEIVAPAHIDNEAAKLTITQNKSQSKTKKEIVFEKIISIAYDNVSKWDKVLSNSQITIHKIKPENSPVVLLRAWAVLEGVPVKECFDQIFDADSRQKWDTVLDSFRVVEPLDHETEVIHFIIKTPFGFTERDFVQKRQHQHDYPEPGTSMISFQSTTHPAVPPFKNRIRGETHIAGYILKPCKHDPNSTDLCILTQVDIKGNIPKAIVNMFAGKAPADWFNKLKKACFDARKKQEETASKSKKK